MVVPEEHDTFLFGVAEDQRREATMTEAEWVATFVMTMGRLGSQADPEHLRQMAHELFASNSNSDPVEMAQAEFDERPPEEK